MKKSMGKRLLSGATSALLALSYGIPSDTVLHVRAAADDKNTYSSTANDGLPILDKPYEQTIWYRNNPLGVAGDFHLFAFDTAITDAHINGNVAAPNLIVRSGVPSPNQNVGRLLNVITDSITWEATANTNQSTYFPSTAGRKVGQFRLNNMTDFLIPVNYEFWAQDIPAHDEWVGPNMTHVDENIKVKLDYPTKIKNTPAEMFFGSKEEFVSNNDPDEIYLQFSTGLDSDAYLGHPADNFIDFKQLLKFKFDTSYRRSYSL